MINKLKSILLAFSFLFVCSPLLVNAAVDKDKKQEKHERKKKQNQQKNQATAEPTVPKGNVEVVMVTSMGKIRLDLFKEKDPVTVNNFLNYVKAGYYNNTIFHRIIDGFIIQGGAYDIGFNEKPNVGEPIKNSSDQGLKNLFGTIAMARKPNSPDSATSQFFINLTSNPFLDYSKGQQGYAVFGKVISGMDVVQKIARVKIGQREGMYNVPFYPEEAVIKSVLIKEPQ